MHQGKIEETKARSGNWLWLSAFGMFGFFALASGKVVLAAGLLFLGVFAFHNNPLKLNEAIPGKPGNALVLSWACGLAGVVAVIYAAFLSSP